MRRVTTDKDWDAVKSGYQVNNRKLYWIDIRRIEKTSCASTPGVETIPARSFKRSPNDISGLLERLSSRQTL